MSTTETQIGVNTNLQKQDLSNLDIGNLTPLSPEVISRQATINIGTIGHVAHGKSTVVKAISGVQTVRFKNELERNITIKLERLSETFINKLLKSPTLLRQFEARQQAKIRYSGNRSISVSERVLRERRHSCFVPSETGSLYNFSFKNGKSTSPSSGYESNRSASGSVTDYESQSTYSFTPKSAQYKKSDKANISQNTMAQYLRNSLKQPILKRRYSQISSSFKQEANEQKTNATASGSGKIQRRKSIATNTIERKRGEYIVEDIDSMESVSGRPMFFVKWYNYPATKNTWEPMQNLNDCLVLEEFIENRYNFYAAIIDQIVAEIEDEIEKSNLHYDQTKLTMKILDEYEPLKLKADLILLAQFREARSRQTRDPQQIRGRVIDMLLLKPFAEKRKEQLQDIRAWQERMNKIEPDAPITVENNIDLEVPDPGFVYITKNFPGKDVHIMEESPIGCTCQGSCQPSLKCCARLADSFFAYDKLGRLRIRAGEAIYECNDKCACSKDCVNRVIQRGRRNKLCLFKTSTGCGWGVRTEKNMCKGDFVCEYVGEIITCEQANERGKLYDARGRTYLFDLDYNTTQDSLYTIDAAMYGNISHFINHSCAPNLAVFPYWVNNLDINMPGLAFFTLRPIKKGEELTFDYIRSDLEQNTEDNVYQNLSDAEKVSCRCGAPNCRKVLF